MDYKHSCVVDGDGLYVTLVLVLLGKDEDGSSPMIQHYALKAGESLADTAPPAMRPCAGAVGFIRPQWDGSAWIEAASAEEITAWETEHPAPAADPEPTAEETALELLAEHEERLCMLELTTAG